MFVTISSSLPRFSLALRFFSKAQALLSLFTTYLMVDLGVYLVVLYFTSLKPDR